ncbi:hypothetical protein BN2127_JRS10_02511 [Bacillus subtilis]|nr:hypothetical protein BN2127_JRS10_02511 [Bacillus subtilis]
MKTFLYSLLEELFQGYEKHRSRMYFVFQKKEEQYIFTDVNQELLQALHQQRADFVGKTIDTAPHLGDEVTRAKLKKFSHWPGQVNRLFFIVFQTVIQIYLLSHV